MLPAGRDKMRKVIVSRFAAFAGLLTTHGIRSSLIAVLFLTGCQNRNDKSERLNYGDAHTHLTSYGEAAIDSLYKYGITTVRDCGGDLALLKKWKNEIDNGRRKGPKIYFAGPMVDGRDEPNMRIGVYTVEQAKQAVDSLALLGVDFIKTHASISPECYFAVLREAKVKQLKVVSHLPQNIAVWIAADSGLSCVEHAAESFLPAPVAGGFVKSTGDSAIFEAIAWWRSAKGDSIIDHLGKLKLFFTPTLYSYKVWALQGRSKEEREDRLKVLEFLKEITFKLHKAGVTILAGTDLYDTTWQNETPGKSLFQEMELIEQSGLIKKEAINSATINLQAWIEK